jgi:hypothetical protein
MGCCKWIKMTKTKQANPVRGPEHQKLSVFLGDWKAEGTSYGGTDQSGPDKKANGVPGRARTQAVGIPANSF